LIDISVPSRADLPRRGVYSRFREFRSGGESNIAFRNGCKESDTTAARNPNPIIIGPLLQSLIAENPFNWWGRSQFTPWLSENGGFQWFGGEAVTSDASLRFSKTTIFI
jgi:hypothetical protein